MVSLTKDDWVEIDSALGSKRSQILNGRYRREDGRTDRKWAKHLKEIQDKIGPDGEHAIKHGVAPGKIYLVKSCAKIC